MLVVHHPDYLPEFVPVNTRERTVSVRLHRGGVIAGQVQGTAGKPLAGVKVAAVSEVAFDGDEVFTDAGGHYEFRALRPGAYTVMASTSGGKPAVTPAPVEVSDGRVATVPFEVKGRGKHMDLDELQLGASGTQAGPVASN